MGIYESLVPGACRIVADMEDMRQGKRAVTLREIPYSGCSTEVGHVSATESLFGGSDCICEQHS